MTKYLNTFLNILLSYTLLHIKSFCLNVIIYNKTFIVMDNIKLFKEFYTENATIVISEPFNFKYFTDTEEKFYKVGFNSFIVPDEFEGIITDDDYAEIKDGKLYIHFNYFPTNYHKNLNKNFITDWITDNFIHDAEEENYSEYFEVNPGEPLIIVADYKGKEIEF